MRKSGVLMHITSLPTPGGIGTLGQACYDFIDFLERSGVNIWQVLPVGPTGYAESPYQSTSTYAGNPLLIDPEMLEQEGFLPEGAYTPLPNTDSVDFEAVKRSNDHFLQAAFDHSIDRCADALDAFTKAHPWAEPYALFMAVKKHFDLQSWMDWPDQAIRQRRPEAVERYRELLGEHIRYHIFVQYLFFSQWDRMHAYARGKGIELMGDMPIYVSEDSADVWLNPELFELDDDLRPIRIAGVPPDYFQADGQRWGNPLYRWDVHEATGFEWWIGRLRAAEALFDSVRIDHFIGFANYYAIPADEPTARNGRYELGPDRKLFRKIRKALPDLKIVAEDLGVVSKRVRRLLDYCGYPGMKVLQFAFDGDGQSRDLPEHHTQNCVVYTGTHDNNTSLGWWKHADDSVKEFAREKLGMAPDDDDILPALLRAAFSSCADTVILPMQDLIGLGEDARMNYPGTVGGNWLWRMLPINLEPISRTLRILGRRYNRGTQTPVCADALIDEAERLSMGRFHKTLAQARPAQLHEALGEAVMAAIAPRWEDDFEAHLDRRHAVYLSAEYLVGRLVYNNLFNLGLLEPMRDLLKARGIDIACMEDIEDAALGNGGLGRLAACFLDSAATMNLPLDGYGLRYRYGLFKQVFEQGRQKELPDDWTRQGDPWSIRRDDLAVTVTMKQMTVTAVPYDMPVIGYGRSSISTLRLWQCECPDSFDFVSFNNQEYDKATEQKNRAEAITSLLYPNDSTDAGKLLRLRQQYVLVSASLQDMMRSWRQRHGRDYRAFAACHAVQLNDTHPTMAIPEWIRLLMLEGLSFEEAFDIARQTFHFTNHTVMSEALEQWDLKLMRNLSTELTNVIRRIQTRLRRDLRHRGISDFEAYDILSNGRVRMANLAVYGSSHTNGVAEIHTEILKNKVFRQWYALYPERFQNKTNGITQRRWLGLCNPELRWMLAGYISEDIMTNLDALAALRDRIDDNMIRSFTQIKALKKAQLSRRILEQEGVLIPEDFVYDVQIKRLHEYKRQLLNALSILDLYYGLIDGTLEDFPKTAFIFGAKAAPGYARAKAIIFLINQIAAKVNLDARTNDRLRVVFVQNYNCSWAESIIPAADLSEQISPAGTEASGTGNMKLMLNGACTVGTYDGANIEIVEAAGEENNFIFGATVEQLRALDGHYRPKAIYQSNARLRRVVDALVDGTFDDPDGALAELHKALLEGASWHAPDHYDLLLDFDSYQQTRLRALRATRDADVFARKCLMNLLSAGRFSSDRTIAQYARDIWKI